MTDDLPDDDWQTIREWPADKPCWLTYCAGCWDEDYGAIREQAESVQFITGGWSDNETIIRAMMANHAKWAQTWESSHRGGLYTFRRVP